jgi:hypothetical protein
MGAALRLLSYGDLRSPCQAGRFRASQRERLGGGYVERERSRQILLQKVSNARHLFLAKCQWPKFLSKARIRFVLLLTVTAIAYSFGHSYLSSENSPSIIYASGPSIQFQARELGVYALVTTALVTPSELSFSVTVTVPPGRSTKLYMLIRNVVPRPYFNPGWTVGNGGDYEAPNDNNAPPSVSLAGRTINVPSGNSQCHFSLSLNNCECYRYSSPYLFVSALNIGGVPIRYNLKPDILLIPGTYVTGPCPKPSSGGVHIPGVPFLQCIRARPANAPLGYPENSRESNPGRDNGTYYYVPERPISEDAFSFQEDDSPPGGGVYSLLSSGPVQVNESTWRWSQVDHASFIAVSAQDKSHSDHRTFLAGIWLGIAGAGVIAALESAFDIIGGRKAKRPSHETNENAPKDLGRPPKNDYEVSNSDV